MALEVSRDVLRASRLARDLRESEQRLKLAASGAGAGLWTWDSASMRVWATEQARAMLGLDQTADIVPADVLRVVDPADAHELSDAFLAALKRGGEHALLFRVVTHEGTVRWIAAQGTVELGPSGEPTLVRGVVRDVTEQRRAEAEAGELRRKLAHVGRVTMLGQLSAALAHEISQPLSAIQQNGETAQILLKREPLDIEQLHAIVDDVVRDNRRATEVVQRLRTWLKQGHMQRETISIAIARPGRAHARALGSDREARNGRMHSAAHVAPGVRRSRSPLASAAQPGHERHRRQRARTGCARIACRSARASSRRTSAAM